MVHLFPLSARGRPQLVSASGHTGHGTGDRSLARWRQPMDCVVGFTFEVLTFLMRYDG